MDKIRIAGLRLFAYHGVNPEEKEKGQPFVLDITMELDLAKPCLTDCVDDTVSYAKVLKIVKKYFLQEKYDLLERAAQVTADGILEEYPAVYNVTVGLKKPRAPIAADFDFVEVEITRGRARA